MVKRFWLAHKLLRAIQFLSFLLYSEGVRAEDYQLQSGRTVSGIAAMNKPPSESYLELLGLKVGKDTLSDALKMFGHSEISKNGDAASAMASLCSCSQDGTIALFQSSEMGGSQNIITTIAVLSKNENEVHTGKCMKDSRISKSLRIGGQLGLNQTRTKIKRLLGTPSKEEAEFIIYQYLYKNLSEKRSVESLVSIEIHFKGHNSTGIYVSKVDTY